ncbi:MAG: phosphatidylinositol kinase [Acidobacteria bacterium]|nr:MAG: phosphatidylinositol kinase [Acidobacteriota bacterium]
MGRELRSVAGGDLGLAVKPLTGRKFRLSPINPLIKFPNEPADRRKGGISRARRGKHAICASQISRRFLAVPPARSKQKMKPEARNGMTRPSQPPSSVFWRSEGARADVPKVLAVEFIRRMRGASQPCLLRGADGAYYVVKFLNNPQHPRILANEMFAARLANLIKLPVPQPAFIEIPEELVRGNPQMVIETGRSLEPSRAGLAFGSRFPGEPGSTLAIDFLPDRLLGRVTRLGPTFLGAYIFDKWTCNCNGRQVLFTRPAHQESGAYCFNDGEWDFPDSPIRSIYPRRLVYESVRGLESFEPFLSRIENLASRVIEDASVDIPQAWCGEDPSRIRWLVERLVERRRRLRQMIVDAKNSDLRPFPNWE